MARSLAERFWSKVAISDPEECWPWTRSLTSSGYGQFRAAVGESPQKASRVAYELTHGSIADGLHVLHKCDNPPCCNPGHLFLGTNADNSADMVRKGRTELIGYATRVRGPRRLTDEQIHEARNRHASGESCRSIARDFNVAHTTIIRLVRGVHWKRYVG